MYAGGNPVTYGDPSGHCIGMEGLFCAESAVATGQQFLGGVIDTGSRYAADAANWTTSTIASTWSGLTQTYQNFAAGFESGVNDLRKEVQSFAVGVDRWAAGVQAQVRSTIASYHIDVSALEAFGQVVLSDPHMMLGMLSVVPGLGEIAAAADMALYLYQGDYANAAMAATMFLPGGAVLAFGLGAKGLREVATLARAGAKDVDALRDGARVVEGLEHGGAAVRGVETAVKDEVELARGGEQAAGAGEHAAASVGGAEEAAAKVRNNHVAHPKNSLDSPVPTYTYKLVSKDDPTIILKHGVSWDPESRYTQAWLDAHNAERPIRLAEYATRREALDAEIDLIKQHPWASLNNEGWLKKYRLTLPLP